MPKDSDKDTKPLKPTMGFIFKSLDEGARVEQLEDLITRRGKKFHVNHYHNQRTLLHMAARAGRLDVVKWLVEKKGAKVDIRSKKHGSTALLRAAMRKRDSVVAYLLEKGAHPLAKDQSQVDTFLVLCAHGNYELAKVVFEKYPEAIRSKGPGSQNALHYIAEKSTFANRDDIKRRQLLIKLLVILGTKDGKRMDVNATDSSGEAPVNKLCGAWGMAPVEMFQTLHECAADMNHPDKYGVTPYARAKQNGRTDVIEFLQRVATQQHSQMVEKDPLTHTVAYMQMSSILKNEGIIGAH